jgi:hypothetical protein
MLASNLIMVLIPNLLKSVGRPRVGGSNFLGYALAESNVAEPIAKSGEHYSRPRSEPER